MFDLRKKRSIIFSFFLLIGGYSSVGRALPLQWCRTNDFLWESSLFYAGSAQKMSFITNALPPFQIDGTGTLAWRVFACIKALLERI